VAQAGRFHSIGNSPSFQTAVDIVAIAEGIRRERTDASSLQQIIENDARMLLHAINEDLGIGVDRSGGR
jgi:hypothetical protein